jgi:1-acyl-sn-glycerol-3-phosphate acyltransferase
MTLPEARPDEAPAPARPGVPGFSRPGETGARVPAGWKTRPLRAAWRAARLGVAVALAFADFFCCLKLAGKGGSARARAEWMSRQARRFLRALNVTVERSGAPPASGVLVANHVGYLDILVLGAAGPLVFVAKSETRGWPVFGPLIRLAGTVFVERARAHDLPRVIAALGAAGGTGGGGDGLPMAFFPEGTSTDGSVVLPFRPALLEPAVAGGQPVTPAHVSYALDPGDGSAADEVCWWGDTDFAPHLLNLFSKKIIRARVAYGPAEPPGDDRKELARRLHARVQALRTAADHPNGSSHLHRTR